jgi:hypothetical protein
VCCLNFCIITLNCVFTMASASATWWLIQVRMSVIPGLWMILLFFTWLSRLSGSPPPPPSYADSTRKSRDHVQGYKTQQDAEEIRCGYRSSSEQSCPDNTQAEHHGNCEGMYPYCYHRYVLSYLAFYVHPPRFKRRLRTKLFENCVLRRLDLTGVK